jgi:hypothetical protein
MANKVSGGFSSKVANEVCLWQQFFFVWNF